MSDDNPIKNLSDGKELSVPVLRVIDGQTGLPGTTSECTRIGKLAQNMVDNRSFTADKFIDIGLIDHCEDCSPCRLYWQTKMREFQQKISSMTKGVGRAVDQYTDIEAINVTPAKPVLTEIEAAKVTVEGRAVWPVSPRKVALLAIAATLIIVFGCLQIFRLWFNGGRVYDPVYIEAQLKDLKLDETAELLSGLKGRKDFQSNQLLQAQYYYLQGRLDGERADFNSAIRELNEAVRLASSIGQDDLSSKATVVLMNIYHLKNDNTRALQYAQTVYDLSLKTGNLRHQVTALQIMGLSQFILGEREAGETKLHQALLLSIQQQNPEFISRTYIYLGVLEAEQRNFKAAKEKIELATATIDSVENGHAKVYFQSITNGYMGRIMALSGAPDQAIEYYNLALQQSMKSGVQQFLLLSQYHNGIADSMIAAGRDQTQIDTEIATAAALEEKAYSRCEVVNPFLSAAVVKKPVPVCR